MSALNQVIEQIQLNNKLLLIFDYDGTLVPITERPEQALLDNEIKTALERLADMPFIKVALVSGRNINTLQKLTGITSKNISMYGIHGGEWMKDGKIHVEVPNSCIKMIKELRKELKDLKNLPGIILEDKKYSISLHYRLADKETEEIAINKFKQIIASLNIPVERPKQTKNIKKTEECYFRYQHGKKVLELLPYNFNKGRAVNSLVKEYPDYFPVYFGDDKTDISAFKEIKIHGGLTILAGKEKIFPVDQLVSIEEIKDFIVNTKLQFIK